MDKQVYVKQFPPNHEYFVVREDKSNPDRVTDQYLYADGTWHSHCTLFGDGYYATLDDAYDALRLTGINDYIVVHNERIAL